MPSKYTLEVLGNMVDDLNSRLNNLSKQADARHQKNTATFQSIQEKEVASETGIKALEADVAKLFNDFPALLSKVAAITAEPSSGSQTTDADIQGIKNDIKRMDKTITDLNATVASISTDGLPQEKKEELQRLLQKSDQASTKALNLKWPTFTGKNYEAYQSWERAFLLHVETLKVDDLTASNVAFMCMQEIAAANTLHLSESCKGKPIKEVLKLLRDIFLPESSKAVAEELFDRCRQLETQAVQEYANEIRSRFSRAFPNETLDTSRHLLSAFLRGLLCKEVCRRTKSIPAPTTFTEAQERAMYYTALTYPEEQKGVSRPSLRYRMSVPMGTNDYTPSTAAQAKSLGVFSVDRKNTTKTGSGSQLFCNFHQSKGHSTSQCRVLKERDAKKGVAGNKNSKSNTKPKVRHRISVLDDGQMNIESAENSEDETETEFLDEDEGEDQIGGIIAALHEADDADDIMDSLLGSDVDDFSEPLQSESESESSPKRSRNHEGRSKAPSTASSRSSKAKKSRHADCEARDDKPPRSKSKARRERRRKAMEAMSTSGTSKSSKTKKTSSSQRKSELEPPSRVRASSYADALRKDEVNFPALPDLRGRLDKQASKRTPTVEPKVASTVTVVSRNDKPSSSSRHRTHSGVRLIGSEEESDASITPWTTVMPSRMTREEWTEYERVRKREDGTLRYEMGLMNFSTYFSEVSSGSSKETEQTSSTSGSPSIETSRDSDLRVFLQKRKERSHAHGKGIRGPLIEEAKSVVDAVNSNIQELRSRYSYPELVEFVEEIEYGLANMMSKVEMESRGDDKRYNLDNADYQTKLTMGKKARQQLRRPVRDSISCHLREYTKSNLDPYCLKHEDTAELKKFSDDELFEMTESFGKFMQDTTHIEFPQSGSFVLRGPWEFSDSQSISKIEKSRRPFLLKAHRLTVQRITRERRLTQRYPSHVA